jgi:DsbC/DsbD-like thiol-disulfide interchange protein
MRGGALAAGLLIGALGASPLAAYQMESLNAPAPKQKSYVEYVAEGQVVKAGVRSVLDLRFHIVDGFHVNSHTPRSDFLIPTKIVLQPAAGVSAEVAEYPAGSDYSFSFDPTNKLSVYARDFTVKVPVVAVAGAHTISGSLHYQACDHAACYPPRSLPVRVIFTAK